ncbi:unnamed protein product (macronuclear) [Paramecium tetraurelia]|uniref:Translation initiation factor eIF2B subunit gamma n=1 Tax=Paramecium tetraurelia TaxID=5888 RepID=A0D7Z4_PARTE|nr:uncharacterized protein GSPATT00014128001 [Paramecium tetraurelia]CAK79161.1 unnamed protein product [Paramecium tetraurelia]|eukprot:XP_001446558.1 hypothetical protein (macronuclear) [Paramecium tetraurelia strain d4-2]
MQIKYQAIILGGGQKAGSMLFPLCQDYSKSLLPICNKPMILYQLDLLETAGFGPQDILILLTKNHQAVADLVQRRAEIFYVSEDSESGSALLEAHEKIKKDFILLSCDSMIGANILDLLDFHYSKKATITCLIKEEDLDKKQGRAPISCNLDESFDIMFIGSDQSLLHITSQEDDDQVNLQVSRNVLLSCQSVQIMTNLFDTHVYVCQYEVLELFQKLSKQELEIQNWRLEFLPYIIKHQKNVNLLNLMSKKEQGLFNERKQQQFSIKVFITQDYARRLNNIKDYQQANYESMIKGNKGISLYQTVQDFQIQNQYPQDARISPDTVIGEGTRIGNKVTIQRSIIGKNCTIGDHVKISNSIIMKNVVINSNCIIQHCILSNESAVGHATELNKCNLGTLASVEPNQKLVDECIIR